MELFSSRPQGGASTKRAAALRAWMQSLGRPGGGGARDQAQCCTQSSGTLQEFAGLEADRGSTKGSATQGGISLVSPNLENGEDRKAEEGIGE